MVVEVAARRAGPSDLGSFWYVILLSVGASAVGAMAVQRGQSRIGFALLSFVFTSPVALVCLFALAVRESSEDASTAVESPDATARE